jgi:hypothetical protein
MRVLNKRLVTNMETFSPELEVTLRIPLEPLQDTTALGTAEAYEKMGRELAGVLSKTGNAA